MVLLAGNNSLVDRGRDASFPPSFEHPDALAARKQIAAAGVPLGCLLHHTLWPNPWSAVRRGGRQLTSPSDSAALLHPLSLHSSQWGDKILLERSGQDLLKNKKGRQTSLSEVHPNMHSHTMCFYTHTRARAHTHDECRRTGVITHTHTQKHTDTLREGNQGPPTNKPTVDDTRHSGAGQQALVSKHLIRPCKTIKMS